MVKGVPSAAACIALGENDRASKLCAMTTLNYDVLRTSKAALDEGLIDQSDYDAVKRSFLKAQQIKAGLDAGFIPEAEYTHVKRTFLESLNLGTSSPDGPISINVAPGRASTSNIQSDIFLCCVCSRNLW